MPYLTTNLAARHRKRSFSVPSSFFYQKPSLKNLQVSKSVYNFDDKKRQRLKESLAVPYTHHIIGEKIPLALESIINIFKKHAGGGSLEPKVSSALEAELTLVIKDWAYNVVEDMEERYTSALFRLSEELVMFAQKLGILEWKRELRDRRLEDCAQKTAYQVMDQRMLSLFTQIQERLTEELRLRGVTIPPLSEISTEEELSRFIHQALVKLLGREGIGSTLTFYISFAYTLSNLVRHNLTNNHERMERVLQDLQRHSNEELREIYQGIGALLQNRPVVFISQAVEELIEPIEPKIYKSKLASKIAFLIGSTSISSIPVALVCLHLLSPPIGMLSIIVFHTAFFIAYMAYDSKPIQKESKPKKRVKDYQSIQRSRQRAALI